VATSIKYCQEGEQKFIVLNFSPQRLENFWTENLLKDATYVAEIWVEKESFLIVKASLQVKGKDDKGNKVDSAYKQIFRSYNSDITIEKPREVFDLKTFEKKI